jgi:hypothetical protein
VTYPSTPEQPIQGHLCLDEVYLHSLARIVSRCRIRYKKHVIASASYDISEDALRNRAAFKAIQ